MKQQDYQFIESVIGYHFINRALLQQAFTRKSYTNETHDGENNEVLEFIGDKVLDFHMVKKFSNFFGRINEKGQFECDYNEGQLTDIKKIFVGNEMLSRRIASLCLNKYLIMSKGDEINKVQEKDSVKGDLFEAIIGAVALDCEYDMNILYAVIERMLDIENYLANNKINFSKKSILDEIDHVSEDSAIMQLNELFQKGYFSNPQYNFLQGHDYKGNLIWNCECYIKEYGYFSGVASTKNEARRKAGYSMMIYILKTESCDI